MTYVKTFIVCGLICLIGQILLDNTKLTSGHITSIFVIAGSILSFFGIYKYIKEFSFIGSSLPITSFGNSLYQAALEGYYKEGIVGIFSNIFNTTSTGISSAIFSGLLFTCLFKERE